MTERASHELMFFVRWASANFFNGPSQLPGKIETSIVNVSGKIERVITCVKDF